MLIGIFGTGRNGSSLISHLLDGLGKTYVHPVEERFLTAFNGLAVNKRVGRLVQQNCVSDKLMGSDGFLTAPVLNAYFNQSLSTLYKHCDKVQEHLPAFERVSVKQLLGKQDYLVEDFTEEYLSKLGQLVRPDISFQHHLFKSIETPYINDYAVRFPNMKFIHIVRDPVDVCSSQKRSLLENKKVPASYLGFDWLSCMLHKRWIPHAKYLKGLANDPRHIVVRYEDLTLHPEAEILRIAEHLGVPAPARPGTQTLFHNLDSKGWGGNPSKKGVDMPATVVRNLQADNDYEEILTEREIGVIANKTSAYLDQFGYRPRSDMTMSDVRKAYLKIDKWEFMHCKTPSRLLKGLYGVAYRRIGLLS